MKGHVYFWEKCVIHAIIVHHGNYAFHSEKHVYFACRLSQLCQVRQLKDVVQYNLFPSADMILSMSKAYGTKAEQWEQKVGAGTKVDVTALPVRMKRCAPLDMHNTEYMKQLPLKHCKDYIKVCRFKLL